jgi:hypothetical protein
MEMKEIIQITSDVRVGDKSLLQQDHRTVSLHSQGLVNFQGLVVWWVLISSPGNLAR